MKDIEAYVKKENAERKKESGDILTKMQTEEDKRKAEAKATFPPCLFPSFFPVSPLPAPYITITK